LRNLAFPTLGPYGLGGAHTQSQGLEHDLGPANQSVPLSGHMTGSGINMLQQGGGREIISVEDKFEECHWGTTREGSPHPRG
jgi:hypothetical protein